MKSYREFGENMLLSDKLSCYDYKEGILMTLLYVGIAGFLGAVSRLWVGEFIFFLFPKVFFPLPTLIVNFVGSYLLAFFLVTVSKKINLSPNLSVGISTGFLGSFTTFSTFSIETLELVQNNTLLLSLIYVFISFAGGLLFSWLGMKDLAKNFDSRVQRKGEN